MSSVLHPVGPEAPQTYWVRRALVLGTALLMLIVVIAVIASQTSNGSVVAAPSPTPSPSPTIPTYTPTPSASTTESADPSTTPSGEASTSAKKSTTPSPTPTKSTEPALAACPADQLRPTLTGKQRLKTKQRSTFTISLINGSKQTCALNLSAKTFELKIYSGTDRIWSSQDCARLVKTTQKKLAPERALEWKIVWNGRRSRAECNSRPEIPRPGTYFATAQFDGAKPIQLRMILT